MNEIEKEIRNKRKHRGFAAGSIEPDGPADPRMPQIAGKDGGDGQAYVQVPGLAEEL